MHLNIILDGVVAYWPNHNFKVTGSHLGMWILVSTWQLQPFSQVMYLNNILDWIHHLWHWHTFNAIVTILYNDLQFPDDNSSGNNLIKISFQINRMTHLNIFLKVDDINDIIWPVFLFPGSRAGAIIAACWATMVYMGEKGYIDTTKMIVETTKYIAKGYVLYIIKLCQTWRLKLCCMFDLRMDLRIFSHTPPPSISWFNHLLMLKN